MAKSSFGVKKIEIGDVQATGLPAVWVEIEAAEIGSVAFTETAGDDVNIFTEQQPRQVFRALDGDPGVTSFTVSTFDMSADTLLLLKGGSVAGDGTTTAKVWSPPAEAGAIEKAVKITTKDDFVITIPNGKVSALIDWTLTYNDLGNIAITVTPQKPLDVALQSYSIKEPLPA